jgi:MSHA biogenesis protein MshE
MDMGIPGYLISSALLSVVSQRLVRLICNYCAAPHTPPPEQLAWFKNCVSEQELSLAKFRKGRGCVRCNGSGYLGRRGVFEVFEMNQELALTLQNAGPSEFEKKVREQIGTYMMERNAHEMVLAGDTTIEEAMNVAAGGDAI